MKISVIGVMKLSDRKIEKRKRNNYIDWLKYLDISQSAITHS